MISGVLALIAGAFAAWVYIETRPAMEMSARLTTLEDAMESLERQQPGWHVELQSMVNSVDDMLEQAGSKLRKSRTGRAAAKDPVDEQPEPQVPLPTMDRHTQLQLVRSQFGA